MRARWLPLALIAAASFGAGGALSRLAAARSRPYPTAEARRLARAVRTIRENYVDSIPTDTLYQRAAAALVKSLHDPYAELMLADAYRRFNFQMSGTQIDLRLPAGPTDGASLPYDGFDLSRDRGAVRPGDEVLAVDGRSIRGLSDADAARLFAADTSTIVTLLVRPRGANAPVTRRVAREAVHVSAVSPGVMLGGGAGYVALRSVTQTSPRELRMEIERLRARGMRSLVLDLRRNPGGLIGQGVQIAELFLDTGDTIAFARGRAGTDRVHVAKNAQPWAGMPVVLLVNRQTASSAEVIAAALQDHDRATVIGTPTYGKGVIQTTYPLANGVAVKFTTARWFAPSGRSIQRRPADSLQETLSQPVYRSSGGRPLRAGYGVSPDVLVRIGRPGAGGVALDQQLRRWGGPYRAVVGAFAADLLERREVRNTDVRVTEAMRNAFWEMLVERDVPVTREVFDAGADDIRRTLEREIVRQGWGDAAEMRSRLDDDRQVQAATSLLRQARTPAGLLAAAMEAASVH
ncbi:MAG: S41 family peptidase [Gemmatimonadota bacterium]